MHHVELSLAVLAALVWSPIAALADEAAEKKKLQGEWRVVGLESDGQEDLGASFQGMRWDFGEKAITLVPGFGTPAGLAGRPPIAIPYTLDTTKTPKHLTKKMGDRPLLGIYRFKGDQLHVCLARYQHARPTGFDTKGTKDWLCYRLERAEANAKENGGIPKSADD